jgi:hypothetical protein
LRRDPGAELDVRAHGLAKRRVARRLSRVERSSTKRWRCSSEISARGVDEAQLGCERGQWSDVIGASSVEQRSWSVSPASVTALSSQQLADDGGGATCAVRLDGPVVRLSGDLVCDRVRDDVGAAQR